MSVHALFVSNHRSDFSCMESATGAFDGVPDFCKSLSSPPPGITSFKDHSDPVNSTCAVRVYRVLNIFVKKTMLVIAPEETAHRVLAIGYVAVNELILFCFR